MFFTVYKITNILNQKYYIGKHKTKNLNDGYFGSGKYLQRAISKYGIENFRKEVIRICDSEEEMDLLEKQLITENEVHADNCYNLKLGGEGGWDFINNCGINNKGKTHEHYVLMGKSVCNKEVNRIAISNRMRELHKAGKIRYDTFTGKHHTEETKRRIGLANSIHQTGSKNSQYGTCWVRLDSQQKSKRIKVEDIEKYLQLGWIKGRKINWKISDSTKLC